MIKIELDNRYETSSVNNRFEYSRTPLIESESKYISIPLSAIVDTELDIKRVGILSYLRVHSGLNDIVGFTIPDMVEWCGSKPDRKTNSTNDKFLNVLDSLVDRGYLTYLNEKSKSAYIKCKLDTAFYYEECSNGYATLYLDEIEKIMKYKKKNKKDNSITNVNILLVFAYLRHKIRRRPNELKPEERTSDGVQKRKERYPEAFDSNMSNIADEIGISTKTLSKIVDILEQELKLIVTDRAYRVKNEKGEFRTLPTIFANAYKREDRYLLSVEKDYSRSEIKLKAKSMKDYKINKTKRKQK